MTRSQQRQVARLHSIQHRSHEKKAAKLIALTFAKQAKILSTFVTKHGIQVALAHLNKIITPEPMHSTLQRIWKAVSADYQKIGTIVKSHSPGTPTNHQDYMKDYASSPYAAQKVTTITDTTRERLRETLKQAADDKLHKRDAAKAIEEATGFSKQRALLIARTETTMAANMGAMTVAVNSGVKLAKYWIATDDDRTREAHADMVGSKPVPIDSPFEVGGEEMLYPGDPTASPANVCNCRCVVAFRPVSVLEEFDSDYTDPVTTHGSGSEKLPVDDLGDRAIQDALIRIINEITAGEEVLQADEYAD